MAAEFLLNLRWHLGRVTHPYGLENTPEALARASAELAFHLGLAKRSQGMAHLTTLTSADLRPEAHSLADPAAGPGPGDTLAEGAGGNVFVLAAQVDHMRCRGALRPRQEEPVEMFTALIAGFQDGDGDEDGTSSGGGGSGACGESDGSSEATFCFLSSGNSSALAARVIDWFERRFDCYVEAFDAVPVATLGLLATRWSVLQPPGNPLDPERTLVLTLAPPAESVVRSIDAITVLVPLAAVFAAILDRRHARTPARRSAARASRAVPARRSGDDGSAMEDADALLLNERAPDRAAPGGGGAVDAQEQEQEAEPELVEWGAPSRDGAGATEGDGDDDDEGDWDALDLVDELCGDMLGLDVHRMTLAEFKTPLVALSSDGFLEIRDLSVVLQVLEDLAGELLLPLTNSSIT